MRAAVIWRGEEGIDSVCCVFVGCAVAAGLCKPQHHCSIFFIYFYKPFKSIHIEGIVHQKKKENCQHFSTFAHPHVTPNSPCCYFICVHRKRRIFRGIFLTQSYCMSLKKILKYAHNDFFSPFRSIKSCLYRKELVRVLQKSIFILTRIKFDNIII